MKTLSFTKMHGLGNNYIYIDGWKHLLSDEELTSLAKSASKVSTGVGSDGLILVSPSQKADVQMRIFNKDGSEGKNCGNGIRCVAKFAFEKGYIKQKTMKIETRSGIVEATISSCDVHHAIVSVNMGQPLLVRHMIPMNGLDAKQVVSEPFEIAGKTLMLTAVSMGNPHAVFFVDHIEEAPYLTLGPLIETDHRFPERTNVEFIVVKSPKEIDFRVWERGSGPTEACGTGACAAVVAAILNGFCKKGERITVHLTGGDLEIEWRLDGDVMMTGPATTVAVGELLWKCI